MDNTTIAKNPEYPDMVIVTRRSNIKRLKETTP